MTLGDLNGDDLLDLSGPAGIYFNTGTAQVPSFDFDTPSPWNKVGGPSWLAGSDQPPHVFLSDVDLDGLLDAYVSNLSSTVWQTLFYKNIGTPEYHRFEYIGPVVASAAPINVTYRGKSEPDFGPTRAFVAAGDMDGNGLTDLLLSTLRDPTIVWSFGAEDKGQTTTIFSYQDLYTYPELERVDYNCGTGTFGIPDVLCKPPNLFSAWTDLTGDGIPDALRTDRSTYELYIEPNTLHRSHPTYSGIPITTTPSGNKAIGIGVKLVDVDLDGWKDLVTGTEDGVLLYFRNTTATGTAKFADPIPLTNASGTAIDVGTQSWPTAIDLDGDGDLDFLVANEEGTVSKVMNVAPGSVNGYENTGLLSAIGQDPLDLTHVVGGGPIAPSLTTFDVDSDGLDDVVMGDVRGRVWILRNVGSASSSRFKVEPMLASRTAAAYLEVLGPRQIRLRFALPTTSGRTVLTYENVSMNGSPVSGQILIDSNTDQSPPPQTLR